MALRVSLEEERARQQVPGGDGVAGAAAAPSSAPGGLCMTISMLAFVT